jgi:hypothetical protein
MFVADQDFPRLQIIIYIVSPSFDPKMEWQQKQFHKQVSALLGVWKGKGRVLSKTDETVTLAPYLEECSFELLRWGHSFCVYRMMQKTKHAEKQKPMHAETGFFKFTLSNVKAVGEDDDDDDVMMILVEAGLTHPFPKGVVTELSTGSFDGKSMKLTSTQFQRAVVSADVSAEEEEKVVTKYAREYEVDGDKLSYVQYLEGIPHLKCEMIKSDAK